MVKGDKPPCLYCPKTSTVTRDGFSRTLRRVIMEDRIGYLLSYRYECSDCSKLKAGTKTTTLHGTFHGYDLKVIDLLNAVVTASFPIVITQRNAILKRILHLLRDDIVHGKGVKACREHLIQAHTERFTTLLLIYVSRLHTARQNFLQAGKAQLLPRVKVELGRTYLDFGAFYDEHRYKGFIPSEHYLSTVYTQLIKMVVLVEPSGTQWTLEEYMHRHQQLIDGQVWGADGSHKEAAKLIVRARQADANSESHRPIFGLYTINNEYSQIVLQVPMLTHSLSDLKDRMRLLALRYKMHSFDDVQPIWSDDCCSDCNLWGNIFQGFDRETNCTSKALTSGTDQDPLPALPTFTLPEGVPYQYVKGDDDAARKACDKLLNIAEEHAQHIGGQLVLGFDAEWNCDVIRSTKIVAIVQLTASDGTTFLFHLKRDKDERRKPLPACIKTLLEDKRVKFVGASIKGDFTRLQNSYEVVVCPDRTVDLYMLTKERKILCHQGRGLDHMVEAFFGQKLEKDLATRLSDWERLSLKQAQIIYACLDAYPSMECYKYIMQHSDACFSPSQPVVDGELNRASLSDEVGQELVVKGQRRTKVRSSKIDRQFVKLTEVLGFTAYKPQLTTATIKSSNGGEKGVLDLRNAQSPGNPNQHRQPPPLTKTASSTQIHPSRRRVAGGILDMDLQGDESDREDSDEEDAFVDLTCGNGRIIVKLDCFHAMNRIAKVWKKAHGAFRPFMARFRDAIFLVTGSDVAVVEQVLRGQGMSDADIEKKKDYE
ncbi:hypothetical protein DFS34DRAFT_663858 [Phlyctochytrium arcticum]|nr:hypothetical protein DFS34DRAFT_663858 [Phlyctochytrium arcticum]